MNLKPGTILIKRYKILSLLQQGGMGATYRGEDLESHSIVAIKQLTDAFQTAQEREAGINNFLSEMNVLKSLHHPQIPKILDHFVDPLGFFFVLEFVEGKDFAAMLNETNRAGLPEEEVIKAGIHVCRVLDYLHSHSPTPIVHRDIKPANIMERASDRRIMVLDFGISRAAKPKEGLMIGTLGYSSPEQHLNQAEARSDIYALGATLHELATGVRPDEESFQFAPPSEIRPHLSQEFSHVIMKALQKNPHERYQSVRHLESALQRLLKTTVLPPAAEPFDEASKAFWQKVLRPQLKKIKQEYSTVCQNDNIPDYPEHFAFTLQAQIPYALLIHPDAEKKMIAFSLKEGMLALVPLGTIQPLELSSWDRTTHILDKFLNAYQQG